MTRRPPPPEETCLGKDTKTSKQKMAFGLSCVGALWTLLSVITTGFTCVGYYMPYWIKGTVQFTNGTETYIGLFRRCNYPALTPGGRVEIVRECGRYTTFNDIPSPWWQAATIVIGIGCGLLVLVTFVALSACCLRGVVTKTTAKMGGVLQFIAAICIGAGCLIYPLGWDSREVRHACGRNSHIYHPGSCTVMWAYYATIGGATAATICSLLSCHAARRKSFNRRHSL